MSNTIFYQNNTSLIESFGVELEHDDLRIIDRYIEVDKNGNANYFVYRLAISENDGPLEEWIKIVKLCKVDHIPKELREKKSLMVIQDEMLSAMWSRDIQFLTVYANILRPKQLGLLYCYGIQVMIPTERTEFNAHKSEQEILDEAFAIAKDKADYDFSGLIRLLEGNYRQCQFRELTLEEADNLRNTMETASNLQVLRGIPKTHITSGSSVVNTVLGTTSTPDAVEQNEEFIRGLLQDQYAVVLIASPIPQDELLQWQQNFAEELSNYKSQISGSIAQNAGISIPMVFAGNLSASLGHSSGTSDSESYNLGTAHGLSQNAGITAGVTDGVTHQSGYSHGFSNATADSVSRNIGDTYGHAISNSHSDGTSEGVSQTKGFTQSHGASSSQSLGFSNTLTNSVGISQTVSDTIGNTHGLTHGTTSGITEGTTQGTTRGFTDGTTHGITNGVTNGVTHGVTRGVTDGYTHGVTNGTTNGYSDTLTNSHGTNSSSGTSTNQGNSYSYGQNSGYSEGRNSSTSDTTGHTSSTGGGTTNTTGGGWSSQDSGSVATGNSTGTSANHSSNWGVSAGVDAKLSPEILGNKLGSVGGNVGASYGQTTGTGISNSDSWTGTNSWSNGTSGSSSNSSSSNWSNADSTSHSVSNGQSYGYNQGDSRSWGQTTGTGISQSQGVSDSLSNAHGTSSSNSNSISDSRSRSFSNSISDSISRSFSNSISDSTSHSISNSISDSYSKSLSNSFSDSTSDSTSRSHGISRGMTYGQSFAQGQSQGFSNGVSDSISRSDSIGQSSSRSATDSHGVTDSRGQSVGTGFGKTASQGITDSQTLTNGQSHANSLSSTKGTGISNTASEGAGVSRGTNQGTSDSIGVGQGMNMAFGPSIGVSRSYQIYDEVKNNLVKILEEQNSRLHISTRMGAFYVDMYFMTHERHTKSAIGLLARSAFGGDVMPGTVQVVDPDPYTSEHLLKHASVFTACTQKEYIENIMEGYLWSTVLLTHELAALTHLPRVEGGGAFTVADNIPPFTVIAGKKGDIYFGKQINYENGKSLYDFYFDKSEFMHTLICGASGCGKTNSAMQIAKEVIDKYEDMKVLVLDWKNSWRVLKRFAHNEQEEFDFYNLDPYGVRPIMLNVYVPPKHVSIMQWRDRVHESLCLAYGFGNKQYAVLNQVTQDLFEQFGILERDEKGFPKESKDAKQLIYKITLSEVYQAVQALKDSANGGGEEEDIFSLLKDLEKYKGKKDNKETVAKLKQQLKNKPSSTGKGMQDTYDSILAKLYPFYAGELSAMYCGTDPSKVIKLHELINGKRIVVLEGGDLDEQAKKFIISTLAWGVFMYSRLRKNRERKVDKRFFILEEAHRIISDGENSSSPLQVTEDIFQIIFNESREYGIYAMPIVQTPSHLPSNVVTNCSIIIVHRLGNKDDIELMTLNLTRNARLDHRDVPLWLTKQPKGTCIVRINNQWQHQYSEPVLIKVAGVSASAPDDEELVRSLDLDLPKHVLEKIENNSYFNKDEMKREILGEG